MTAKTYFPFCVNFKFMLDKEDLLTRALDLLDACISSDMGTTAHPLKDSKKGRLALSVYQGFLDYVESSVRNRNKLGTDHALTLLRLAVPETVVESSHRALDDVFSFLAGSSEPYGVMTDDAQRAIANYFIDHVYPIYEKDIKAADEKRAADRAKEESIESAREQLSRDRLNLAAATRLQEQGWIVTPPVTLREAAKPAVKKSKR